MIDPDARFILLAELVATARATPTEIEEFEMLCEEASEYDSKIDDDFAEALEP